MPSRRRSVRACDASSEVVHTAHPMKYVSENGGHFTRWQCARRCRTNIQRPTTESLLLDLHAFPKGDKAGDIPSGGRRRRIIPHRVLAGLAIDLEVIVTGGP